MPNTNFTINIIDDQAPPSTVLRDSDLGVTVASQAALNAAVAGFVHTQAVAAAVWTITHNLNRHPSVTVIDSAGDLVFGDVHYVNTNQITVTHGGATGGVAYLN